MGRPRLADGMREVLAFKASEQFLAAVNRRRGRMPLSRYLRSTIADDLKRAGVLEAPEAGDVVPQVRFSSPARQ
jgi:hypothetical protein